MSLRRPYDKLMLDQGMPWNLMVRRLLVEERWTFVVCLCLASQAPGDDRGTLIVSAAQPIDPEEIADAAGVDVEVVKATLAKLADHGTLLEESDHGALRFANWDLYNPKPKPSDLPENQNERKRRSRANKKAAEVDQLALDHQAEMQGETPQIVMDESGSTGLRSLDDDPLNRPCPVKTCLVDAGTECRDRNGRVKAQPHAKRKRQPNPAAFFRTDRGGDLVRPALPADADGWAPIAGVLRQEIDDDKFDAYLAPLQLVAEQGDTLYVRAPDHARTWVRDRYLGLVNDAAREVRGPAAVVELVDEQWRPAERAA
jgi:hypothetical protein